jgi:dipeptidyl aminopeptidase/acylaminoacyl peptidase
VPTIAVFTIAAACSSSSADDWNFYFRSPDGSGSVERLTDSSNSDGSGSWSPDGKVFAFHESASSPGIRHLWSLDATSRRSRPMRATQPSYSEQEPTFSPDGHWLAFVSTESGRAEVFVQPFPSLSAKWQMSTDGGRAPVWDGHGRERFYQNGGKIMAVAIQPEPSFVARTPRLLFQGNYFAGTWRTYDVAPDGRFIMIQSGPTENASKQNCHRPELVRRAQAARADPMTIRYKLVERWTLSIPRYPSRCAR